MAERARIRAVVKGRVQGVGYRWFVLAEARGMGLVGEVRNLRDHTVEVIAEGDRPLLEGMVDRLKEGPMAATVEGVAVDWEQPTGGYHDFEIAASR